MEKKIYQPGEYSMLIGNKEPGNIKKQGLIPAIHIASDAEYWFALKARLTDESRGLFEESDSVPKLIEKMAEIKATLMAIADFAQVDERQIDNMQELIETRDGSFSKRTILDKIDN